MQFDLHVAIQRFVLAIFFLLVRFMKAGKINFVGHKNELDSFYIMQ